MNKNTPEFPRRVPPLSELPRCESCGKPHMPLVPGAADCFKCALAARRKVQP